MKRGNYNCYVLYLSKRQVRGKTKYKLNNWKVFFCVTKELACFYAERHGSMMLGYNQLFTKRCEIPKAKVILSYNPYDNVVCIVQKYRMVKGCGWDALYPHHPCIEISIEDFSYKMERIIECFQNYNKERKKDYSIEASYIWGPRNLIPKGYEHITSGEVKEGDLYWHIDSYGSLNDYWCKCEISFSGHKPGSKILLSGITTVYRDGSKSTTNYYEPFVVRKKE